MPWKAWRPLLFRREPHALLLEDSLRELPRRSPRASGERGVACVVIEAVFTLILCERTATTTLFRFGRRGTVNDPGESPSEDLPGPRQCPRQLSPAAGKGKTMKSAGRMARKHPHTTITLQSLRSSNVFVELRCLSISRIFHSRPTDPERPQKRNPRKSNLNLTATDLTRESQYCPQPRSCLSFVRP